MSEAFWQLVRQALEEEPGYDATLPDPKVPIRLLGAWIPDRAPPQVAFATIPLDGFELGIYAKKRVVRGGVGLSGPPTVGFELYEIETNDPGMSEAWIDMPIRSALVHAQIFQRFGDDGRLGGTSFVVVDNSFVVTPLVADKPYLARLIRAGITLAQRPRRLATELRAGLGALGAELAADDWRLDDRCTAVFARGAATVQLDWRRDLTLRSRLRTRLRAHGPDAPADAAALAAKLDQLRPLAIAANAAAITVARGEITLLWNGLVRTATMVAPAIELLCRLVAPLPSAAPMR